MILLHYLHLLLLFFTALVGIAAYLQFKKNTEIKRAEFLMKLYKNFYESKHLEKISEWVDSEENKTQENFDKMLKDRETEFTDFLNFFQLIVILKNMGQLEEKEIKQMFHYYLKLIKNNEFIMIYLSKYYYNELSDYLKQYPDDK
jgi:hypothetical protein